MTKQPCNSWKHMCICCGGRLDRQRVGWLGQLHRFSFACIWERTWSASSSGFLGSRRSLSQYKPCSFQTSICAVFVCPLCFWTLAYHILLKMLVWTCRIHSWWKCGELQATKADIVRIDRLIALSWILGVFRAPHHLQRNTHATKADGAQAWSHLHARNNGVHYSGDHRRRSVKRTELFYMLITHE